MVLDTKARRDMLQQAAAMGERTQFAAGRVKVPTLVILSGNTDQKEYVLTNKLTVIGKSKMATVRLKGWFKPQLAAQVNQRDDGYLRRLRATKCRGQRSTHHWTRCASTMAT